VVFRSFTAAHDRLILTATALSAAALMAAWLLSLMVPKRAETPALRPAPTMPAPEQEQEECVRTAAAAPAADRSGPGEEPAPAAGKAGPGHEPAPAPGQPIPTAAPASPGATSYSASAAAAVRPVPLDLDAFMRHNFTSADHRRSFISTVAASIRKLPADASAVSANPPAAPPLLHTLKGAWGSLGANAFAHAAGELERAIKQQRPYEALLATFAREAAALRAVVEPWLARREADAPPPPPAASAPEESLLPMLRERSINASAAYERSRAYWDARLGSAAPAFSAAMDALDFATAERLLAVACPGEP
jgi:HPt (histidine-containing phosphotransfer) domain-containing protein